jgi:guanine deaminase
MSEKQHTRRRHIAIAGEYSSGQHNRAMRSLPQMPRSVLTLAQPKLTAGGGASFSLIRTQGEAYKVSQMLGRPLPPLRAWWLATLAGARALYLDEHIGNFLPGKEADCVVLNPTATPELAYRLQHGGSLSEQLFALMVLGDERCVVATHVLGRPVMNTGNV